MSILMLTCKEASRLSSEALDRKLSFRERLLLRVHLTLCKGCTQVDTQFQFLRHAMSQWLDSPVDKDVADRG